MRTALFSPGGFAPSAFARVLVQASPAPLRRARLRRAFFLFAALVPIVAAANPQRSSSSATAQVEAALLRGAQKAETPHLLVTTSLRPSTSRPGSRVSLLLEITPKPNMHVYAPAQKEVIPISLSLEQDESFQAHPPRLPRAEKYFFEPLNETQLVYSRPFEIVQDVTIADTPAMRDRIRSGAAQVTVSGTLRYQACDEKVCYMPQTLAVSWTVPVKPNQR